jgi:hypothetical protein
MSLSMIAFENKNSQKVESFVKTQEWLRIFQNWGLDVEIQFLGPSPNTLPAMDNSIFTLTTRHANIHGHAEEFLNRVWSRNAMDIRSMWIILWTEFFGVWF